MVQNAFHQLYCKICKTLVSQDIIKLWSCFYICDYTFLDSANQFNHFAFMSSGKHWFRNVSNYVINSSNDDHNNDNNSNYVDYNNQENDVKLTVIMTTMVTTVMIMKTRMIKILQVMIIFIMVMIRHQMPRSLYTCSWMIFRSWF